MTTDTLRKRRKRIRFPVKQVISHALNRVTCKECAARPGDKCEGLFSNVHKPRFVGAVIDLERLERTAGDKEKALATDRSGTAPATAVGCRGGLAIADTGTGEITPVVTAAPGILANDTSGRSLKSEIDEVANVPSSAWSPE